MSSFFESVERASALLARHGRVSLRGLRRELELDAATFDDLVEELVEGRRVARRDATSLEWRGDASEAVASVPSPRPQAAEAPGTGERRQITVMFCDVVGSTELAQRVDPEELVGIMRDYRSVCIDATQRYGGHIAQYLGDGVLVYFGYPQASEDQADCALRAALDIQHSLRDRPEQVVRIGIHTGLVVVEPHREGEDALAQGSTINFASRFQALAEPGSVVASDATLSLCRSRFATSSLGETRVKGSDEAFLLHRVEGVLGLRSTIEIETEGPLFGRDLELGLLLQRWQAVQKGRGQVILLNGEPGMGKSRLVRAFRESLADTPHLWIAAQCSPWGSSSAFQPLVEQLESGFGLREAASAEEVRDRLVDALEGIPELPCEDVAPYLLPLLSLPPSARHPLPQTSSDEQRDRTLAALLQLTATLSEQEALVFVVEDLHWADPSTLDFLGRLVEQAGALRVMVIATFRPEFAADWPHAHVTEVKLARLPEQVTHEMVSSLLAEGVSETTIAAIERRSDGVPLFVEELVAGVVSSGPGAPGVRANDPGEEQAIPASLQDSLMARLDRLGASKRVAQQGATLGHEFSHALIAAVSDLDASELEEALGQLVDAQILHRRGRGPDALYSFRHALLQDTAYESQLRSARKELHARIAVALEEGFPRRVESEPELMAQHCAAAGRHDAAVDHFVRAAERATARLANAEASDHYRRALDALASLPESDARNQREIAIRVPLGQAGIALGGADSPEVVANFARVEELCEAVGPGPQQILALIGLMSFEGLQRVDPMRARARAQALLDIAEPLGMAELLVVGHTIIAASVMGDDSATQAEERLRLARDIAKSVDFPPPATQNDPDILCVANGTYVLALAACALPDRIPEALERMRERFAEIDHDLSRVSALANVAAAGYVLDDPEFCLAAADEALAIADGRGFLTNEAILLVFRSWAKARRGDMEGAVADVERGLAVEDAAGGLLASGYYDAIAADVHRMAGNWKRATELLDRAAPHAGDLACAAAALWYARGMLALSFGEDRLEDAEHCLRRALDGVDHLESRWQQVQYATQLARIAERRGDLREAHALLADRYAGLREGLDRATPREARELLDALARRLD